MSRVVSDYIIVFHSIFYFNLTENKIEEGLVWNTIANYLDLYNFVKKIFQNDVKIKKRLYFRDN